MTETAITAGFITTCTGVSGGWRRIINIEVSAGNEFPSGWRQASYSGVSFCLVVSDDIHTCTSAHFSTNGTSYHL